MAETHIMRVALHGRRSVRREIEIAGSRSLYKLAEAIVGAFDFDFDHCFGFYSGKTRTTLFDSQPQYELFADIGEESKAGSVKKTAVATAFPRVGYRMIFLFDYGDEWLFDVERIGSGETKPKTRYPRIVSAVGRAPEQYPALEED